MLPSSQSVTSIFGGVRDTLQSFYFIQSFATAEIELRTFLLIDKPQVN